MPAVISHYLLAERVYKKISSGLPELNRNLFLWGANGPDIFFSHRLMPWQLQRSLAKISHIMHGTSAEIILNYLYKYSKINEDFETMSYALGFVTHYAYDSSAHPYIVDYSEKMANGRKIGDVITLNKFPESALEVNLSSVYHNKLEGELDTILLMHEMKIPSYMFKLEYTSPKDKNAYNKVAEVLTSYLTTTDTVPDIGKYEIIRSMADWRNALRILNDKFSLKRNFVKTIENIFGIPPVVSVFFRNIDIDLTEDPANLCHHTWTSPVDGTIHNESFLELTDIAEEKSICLIEKLKNGELLTKDDCRLPFNGH